jgi:hypothetical protein
MYINYYENRGLQHNLAGDKALATGTWALGIVAIINGFSKLNINFKT